MACQGARSWSSGETGWPTKLAAAFANTGVKSSTWNCLWIDMVSGKNACTECACKTFVKACQNADGHMHKNIDRRRPLRG